MKLISAVIRPEKLDDVRAALTAAGLNGMTAWPVSGVGQQAGHKETYRGQNYTVDLLPKVKLELAVHEENAEKAIKAIIDAADSGTMGDGKIWVTQLEQIIRIRTGETGDTAF
jgi:nitrogen regulatory protein P-II 2